MLVGSISKDISYKKDTQGKNREKEAEVLEDRGRDWRGAAKEESPQSPGAKGKGGFS